ncbi:sulfatase [Bacteroidota bacterium]
MKRLKLALPKTLIFPVLIISVFINGCEKKEQVKKPNILLCIADDWGWPHAGVYGDQVVKTPTFNRLAEEGVLFENAFVSCPSCTPSRSALLTGQHFWRLGESANLWSTLDVNIPVYPLLLEKEGYYVGSWRKSWGPGDLKAGGYDSIAPAGKKYPEGFNKFLKERPANTPFCFWLGASDPHRPYEKGSGAVSGIDIDAIKVPGFYPDSKEIRSDIADYYFEVQRFDSDVGAAMDLLDSIGELENTIIVMTGDHGMPFPRCKGNLYDMGVRVPLAVRWGEHIEHNRRTKEFVSFIDIAPTFLKLAGVEIPSQMTGRSLEPILMSGDGNWVIAGWDYAVFGRERHTPAQLAPSMAGYPSRGIRTKDYLYIRNFSPERWPTGVPEGASHPSSTFTDCDGGPTKTFLLENADNPDFESYINWCFNQRPSEELYDIKKDPDQLVNLADDTKYASIKNSCSDQLNEVLRSTEDPRINGTARFDEYPYRSSYKLNSGK